MKSVEMQASGKQFKANQEKAEIKRLSIKP